LFPEWFAQPQEDWPPALQLTGFPIFDQSGVSEIPAGVAEFLNDGEPPVVFTFGSEYRFARDLLRESAAACKRGGFRGILLSRHADQVPADLPGGVRHFAYVPLSLLLPTCAAIVHAGGIGTTAVALASGTPQIIVPHAHDQPDNAARLRQMGVALVLAHRTYSANSVASALQRLMSSSDITRSCEKYRDLMAADDPLPRACELIESVTMS
jgi:UDP:flavonoid glycosyltransferase YjiC (YdhE family)